MSRFVNCPETTEFYRTLNKMATGNIQYPGNSLTTFAVVLPSHETVCCSSIFAALEYLKAKGLTSTTPGVKLIPQTPIRRRPQ